MSFRKVFSSSIRFWYPSVGLSTMRHANMGVAVAAGSAIRGGFFRPAGTEAEHVA